MSAARKRGRPETPPADYGPRVRLNNGTAFLTYRPDPEKPSAPAIRAAQAYVAYEHLDLTPGQFAAAKRLYDACADMTGAREDNGGSLGGRAYWQVGGPTMTMLDAAKDLRVAQRVLGNAHFFAVIDLLANGVVADLDVLRGALETMAGHWGC